MISKQQDKQTFIRAILQDKLITLLDQIYFLTRHALLNVATHITSELY